MESLEASTKYETEGCKSANLFIELHVYSFVILIIKTSLDFQDALDSKIVIYELTNSVNCFYFVSRVVDTCLEPTRRTSPIQTIFIIVQE